MSERNGVDLALLDSAGRLESIARDVESVDASVPILCGVAANKLRALLGATATELPQVGDCPQAVGLLLDRVAAELATFDREPAVIEALALVRSARREVEVS